MPLFPTPASELGLRNFSWGEKWAIKQIAPDLFPKEMTSFVAEFGEFKSTGLNSRGCDERKLDRDPCI